MIISNKKNIKNILFVFVFYIVSFFAPDSAFSQFQIKIATLAPQNSEWAQKFLEGSTEIQKKTDNRVKLKFYWGGAQGNAKKNLQKIKIGQIHGATFSPTDFQEVFPDLNIYGLPFLFRDHSEVDFVRRKIDDELELGFKKLRFNTYGFAGGGFAYVMSNNAIKGYDDLQNKKIWLPQGDLISYKAMESLNLLPIPLPMTDVLTGLQTGLIDIVAIPPVVALALQWHTKINYITKIPVLYAMGFLAIDTRVINRLSKDDRKIVSDVITRIYNDVDTNSQKDSDNAYNALINIGIKEVEFEDLEYKRLADLMVKPNIQMANDGLFSLELFERIRGYIEDYRKMQ